MPPVQCLGLAVFVFCWLQMSPDASCPTAFINVALHKPVAQTSTALYNGRLAIAANAVDGDTTGPPAVTQSTDTDARWQVDLGQQQEITTIRSFFGDTDILNRVYQFVLYDKTNRKVAALTLSLAHGSSSHGFQLPPNVLARFVQVTVPLGKILNLREVQVFSRFLNVTPTNLQCSTWSKSTDKIVCRWQQPPSCSDSLSYTILLLNSNNQNIMMSNTVSSTNYTFDSVTSFLGENSNYTIQVRVETADNLGSLVSQTFISPGSASSPTSLTCLSASPYSIRLGWKAPTYQHPDLPVTGYSVTFNNTHFHAVLPETTLLEIDVDGLSPNTTHLFGVSALNDYGSSESTHVRCTTAVVECQLCTAQSGLRNSFPTSVVTTQSLSTSFTSFPSQEILTSSTNALVTFTVTGKKSTAKSVYSAATEQAYSRSSASSATPVEVSSSAIYMSTSGFRGESLSDTRSVLSHPDAPTPSDGVKTVPVSVEDRRLFFIMIGCLGFVVIIMCILLLVITKLVSKRRSNKAQLQTGKSKCCLRQSDGNKTRYADPLGPRPGLAGETLGSEYFNVDVEGEFSRVAPQNLTRNEGYGVRRLISESPATVPVPRHDFVYEEVNNHRNQVITVDDCDMTCNVGYAETKL